MRGLITGSNSNLSAASQTPYQYLLLRTAALEPLDDIGAVVKQANASAVAIGSMVVFQKKGMGVIVNFPEQCMLSRVLP